MRRAYCFPYLTPFLSPVLLFVPHPPLCPPVILSFCPPPVPPSSLLSPPVFLPRHPTFLIWVYMRLWSHTNWLHLNNLPRDGDSYRRFTLIPHMGVPGTFFIIEDDLVLKVVSLVHRIKGPGSTLGVRLLPSSLSSSSSASTLPDFCAATHPPRILPSPSQADLVHHTVCTRRRSPTRCFGAALVSPLFVYFGRYHRRYLSAQLSYVVPIIHPRANPGERERVPQWIRQ